MIVVRTVVLLALTVGLQPQSNTPVATQPNPLLGGWRLNLAKSKFRHDSVPESETRGYKACEGDGVETHVETEHEYSRVVVTNYCDHLDGKEYPIYGRIGDKISAIGPNWGTVNFTVTNKGKLVRKTHSVVSQDGKTLTRTTSYPVGDHTETDIQVYDKLPE